jgi:hypothetical protein
MEVTCLIDVYVNVKKKIEIKHVKNCLISIYYFNTSAFFTASFQAFSGSLPCDSTKLI